MKYAIIAVFGLSIMLFSCGEENYIPKPPTYLRLELPDHSYKKFDKDCPYTFEIAETFDVKTMRGDTSSCSKEIDLGKLNGSIFLHYWKMDKPLSFYINSANDEVDRHKIKATSIDDSRIIRESDRVFGTYFKFQGDVATPFQFYLTDSTTHFVYAEVLFNSIPNYDSLKPSLDYLDVDLKKMLETFKWK